VLPSIFATPMNRYSTGLGMCFRFLARPGTDELERDVRVQATALHGSLWGRHPLSNVAVSHHEYCKALDRKVFSGFERGGSFAEQVRRLFGEEVSRSHPWKHREHRASDASWLTVV